MTKKVFTSLLLGFGSTLAVLVVISMPPGGWGVAVGLAFGLLAALPLFLIVMALLKRQAPISYQPNPHIGYPEPQAIPPVLIIQQQLSQGQAMPLPAHAYAYSYPEQYAINNAANTIYPDDYVADYYEQQYLPEIMPDPRLLQKSRYRQDYEPIKGRRPRPRPSPIYYEQPDAEYAYYPEYLDAEQAQANDFSFESNNDYYFEQATSETLAPPDLAYYEQQQVRRRRAARQRGRPDYNSPSARNNNFFSEDSNQIVEAEYREINPFGEDQA